MVTLRRLGFAVLLLVLVLAAAVFAYSNPESIAVDIGIVRFERVSMAAAFGAALALGWLLGLLTAGVALWRSAAEKRRLRRDLRYAEAELGSLREPALPDAN